LDERIKKLTIIDISLVKLSSFFFAIIIVKLIPTLLSINYIMLIILTIACGARPFYIVWISK